MYECWWHDFAPCFPWNKCKIIIIQGKGKVTKLLYNVHYSPFLVLISRWWFSLMQFLGPCELGAQEQYVNNGTVQKMQGSSQALLLKGQEEKAIPLKLYFQGLFILNFTACEKDYDIPPHVSPEWRNNYFFPVVPILCAGMVWSQRIESESECLRLQRWSCSLDWVFQKELL